MYPIILFILFIANFLNQFNTEQNIDSAYMNAKKGIYWGLSHASAKQNSIKNNLIDNDKLICSVKLNKEVNGVHIESAGYYEGCEVKISLYKSSDNLISEGYIQPVKPDTLINKTITRKRKTK